MEEIESKLRRSSCMKEDQIFREFLAYASMVRDPEEVYDYMEGNKIGLDQPEFWASKLNLLIKKGQYCQFVSLLKRIRSNHTLHASLKKNRHYCQITQLQAFLERELENKLRRKVRGRRSAREYEVLNYSNVQKPTKKFGNIQIYVDPQCRMSYRIEDLANFVNERLKDDCEIQKNFYQRECKEKPLSFLGRKDEQLKALSQELLNGCKRQSELMRKSLKPRNSYICQTPQFSKKNRKSFHLYKENSVEILKKMMMTKRTSKSIRISSSVQDPEKSQQSQQKQTARISPIKHSKSDCYEILNISDFSFGVNDHDHNNDSENLSETASIKDHAFIEDHENPEQPEQATTELEQVIKEIQLQRNQSQTISEIDSNKENAFDNFESSQQSYFGIKKDVRYLFETIRKKDEGTESDNEQEQDSGDLLFNDLVQKIGEKRESGSKNQFLSEKKRISRISEEKSYSLSELKQNSRERRSPLN